MTLNNVISDFSLSIHPLKNKEEKEAAMYCLSSCEVF
jgi:hypothetical protein